MSMTNKIKRYYSWVEVWRSSDSVSSKSLELAFYKLNITARMGNEQNEWVLKVPWIYEEVAITAVQAYKEGHFEYPTEIQVNERWESYNRFKPHKYKGRTYKMILVLGLLVFLLLVIRTFYGAGIFG